MKIFWPEFPYTVLGHARDVKDWFEQTVDEAKHMLHLAQADRERKRKRNAFLALNHGFIELKPNGRFPEYTSTRAEQRRSIRGQS